MPRRVEHSASYPVPPARLHAAFTDEAYWTARVDAVGGAGATLDDVSRRSGGLAVTLTQVVAAQHLPAIVSRLVNGDLRITRTETWGALAAGDTEPAATAEGTATVRGTPAEVSTTSSLTGDAAGCTVRTTGQARVPVPLIGGSIEQVIADNVTRLLVAEQRFTQGWLAR